MLELLSNYVDLFKAWFQIIKLGDVSVVRRDKLVWINLEDAPLNPWHGSSFSMVRNDWGSL